MGTISFRSVGVTADKQVTNQLTTSPSPVGIVTPLRLGTAESIFEMTYSLSDQVHDNLRNLLLTNWGERLVLYDFGANLRPLTSEFTTQDDFDAQAVQRISSAVSKWMPYVTLEDFLSQVNRNGNKNTAIIDITVTYSVPALNVSKRALQVTLYAL